ncbi:hypothetical protein L4D13_19045 [Photobacterium profundum]|uniref:hypothetical protein n=1 Tax=Photobacterium profundum TaxID=74109 RepID=UPI003D0990B3
MDIREKLKWSVGRVLDSLGNDEALIAFTVRVEPYTYQAAITSGNAIDYLAKNIKRHLKGAGLSTGELWFSLEFGDLTKASNPHVHGGIRIKADELSVLSKALQNSLGRPLSQSAARKKSIQQIYSSDWVDYCLKDTDKVSEILARSPLFMTQNFRNIISDIFGKTYTSKNSRKLCYHWSQEGVGIKSSSYSNNPLNNTTKSPLKTTSSKSVKSIYEILEKLGVLSTPPPKAEVSVVNNL